MSLQTDTTALIAEFGLLRAAYEAKKNGIDAAVAGAIAALPSQYRVCYLDGLNGSDANDGLTPESPVQSIQRAFGLAGPGRVLELRLMRDYALPQARNLIPPDMALMVISHGATETNNVRFKLHLGLHARDNADGLGNWQVGSLYGHWGRVSVNLLFVEVVFPPANTTGTLISDVYNGLVSANSNFGPTSTGLEIVHSIITRPPGSVGVILGTCTRASFLAVKTTTYNATHMAGAWVAGIPAGTASASFGLILTTLPTL